MTLIKRLKTPSKLNQVYRIMREKDTKKLVEFLNFIKQTKLKLKG